MTQGIARPRCKRGQCGGQLALVDNLPTLADRQPFVLMCLFCGDMPSVPSRQPTRDEADRAAIEQAKCAYHPGRRVVGVSRLLAAAEARKMELRRPGRPARVI